MANVLDFHLVVSEFECQSRYDIHFWTNTLRIGTNPLILTVMDLILSLLSFYEDDFGIK